MISNDTNSTPAWAQAAHDLRQPIQSLLLMTQAMSGCRDETERRQIADAMDDTLISLQDMFDGLATLAKLEAGYEPASVGPCLLSDVCARAEASLKDRISERGIHLSLNAAPVEVTTNASLFEKLIAGLIGNALHYTSGEVVRLECNDCRRIEVGFDAAQIPPRLQDAVFIEILRPRGACVMSQAAPGLGYLARLANVLGWRLDTSASTNDRQTLVLTARSNATADAPC
ncbi:MAG: HAMP domain-containing histidine kinase [Alphaproteobacteria bacterium]|nr:HAMP domain-containing histidine kinase [Alphaproteobacteria bacterium]